MGASGGNGLQTLIMLLVALLLAGLALQLRFTQPLRYRLEPDGLVIERRRGETRVPGRVARHTERATLGLRLGTGGIYGYRGRFRVSGLGWARSFATDVRRVALIDVGGQRIVLSPLDPAALVQEVAHA